MAKKIFTMLFSSVLLTVLTVFARADIMPDYLSKIIPIGSSNTIAGEHFTGKSFLAPLSTQQVGIFNVTFESGSYNELHTHFASKS